MAAGANRRESGKGEGEAHDARLCTPCLDILAVVEKFRGVRMDR